MFFSLYYFGYDMNIMSMIELLICMVSKTDHFARVIIWSVDINDKHSADERFILVSTETAALLLNERVAYIL